MLNKIIMSGLVLFFAIFQTGVGMETENSQNKIALDQENDKNLVFEEAYRNFIDMFKNNKEINEIYVNELIKKLGDYGSIVDAYASARYDSKLN